MTEKPSGAGNVDEPRDEVQAVEGDGVRPASATPRWHGRRDGALLIALGLLAHALYRPSAPAVPNLDGLGYLKLLPHNLAAGHLLYMPLLRLSVRIGAWRRQMFSRAHSPQDTQIRKSRVWCGSNDWSVVIVSVLARPRYPYFAPATPLTISPSERNSTKSEGFRK